jgi:hypothetical protein
VLNCRTLQQGVSASPLVMVPDLFVPPSVACCASTTLYYDPRTTDVAWTLLMNASHLALGAGRDNYLNDVADIATHVIADYSFLGICPYLSCLCLSHSGLVCLSVLFVSMSGPVRLCLCFSNGSKQQG